MRTLRRCFHELRCGIFARVDGRRLACFVPFANPEFRNRWAPLRLRYGAGRQPASAWIRGQRASEGATLLDGEDRWWCNGSILCNEVPASPDAPAWGSTYVYHLLDMLVRAAAARPRGSGVVELMVNKRDHPQHLRFADADRDPYLFLWGGDAPGASPPCLDVSGPCLRFLSFYTSNLHADILVPNTDDIEAAAPEGTRYPPHFQDTRAAEKVRESFLPFAERRPKEARAFFRGGATGRGVTPETNVRLRLAAYSAEHPGVADAGIVSWNVRAKFQGDGTVQTVDARTIQRAHGIRTVPRVPQYLQARMPILVYADGHCAASRLGSMLGLGAVVLRVASLPGVPGRQWSLDRLERETRHLRVTRDDLCAHPRESVEEATHFLVDRDLGNLRHSVLWVRMHPDSAARVAENGRKWSARTLTERRVVAAYRDAIERAADIEL